MPFFSLVSICHSFYYSLPLRPILNIEMQCWASQLLSETTQVLTKRLSLSLSLLLMYQFEAVAISIVFNKALK